MNDEPNINPQKDPVYKTLFLTWYEVGSDVYEARNARTENTYRVMRSQINPGLWRAECGSWSAVCFASPRAAMHAAGMFEGTEMMEKFNTTPNDVYEECRRLAVYAATRNQGMTTPEIQKLDHEDHEGHKGHEGKK